LKLRWRSATKREQSRRSRTPQSSAEQIKESSGREAKEKVGSRPGRSVLPKSSGSGARRPLDQKKSETPLFHGVGDEDRNSSSGRQQLHSPCQSVAQREKFFSACATALRGHRVSRSPIQKERPQPRESGGKPADFSATNDPRARRRGRSRSRVERVIRYWELRAAAGPPGVAFL